MKAFLIQFSLMYNDGKGFSLILCLLLSSVWSWNELLHFPLHLKRLRFSIDLNASIRAGWVNGPQGLAPTLCISNMYFTNLQNSHVLHCFPCCNKFFCPFMFCCFYSFSVTLLFESQKCMNNCAYLCIQIVLLVSPMSINY